MANNFADDSSCKALWRFEPGALLEDSIGGNDLSQGGAYNALSETTIFKEGDGSVKTVSDYDTYVDDFGYLRIANADVDAGFPWNDGDTNKVISFSGWLRLAADNEIGTTGFFRKVSDSGTKYIELRHRSGLDGYILTISNNAAIQITDISTMEAGKWYHVGLAVDGVAKTYLLRHYDLDADTATTKSGSFYSEPDMVHASPTYFEIGKFYSAYFDEFAIFDELKTADDFDDMRSGSYAPPVNLTVQGAYHVHTAQKLWEDVVEQYADNVSIGVDLEIDNAYHLHVAENVAAQHVLPVIITTEQEDGSHPLLPTLEGLSSFFTGIRMDGDLPGVSIESRFAARMEGKLPSLGLSAALLPGGMMTMEGRLPSLEFTEGRFGARSDNLKLPSISIESEMITGSIMTLDGKLFAAGIESRFGSVASGTFPAISIEASMTGGGVLTLDGRISVLSVESKFGSRLEGDLPGLTIESELTRTGGLMSLEGDLPSINFVEGRFGVRANGNLPGISLESVMIAGGLMSLDQNLPPLSLASVFGARTEDMRLPAFSLESSLSAKAMTLDGRLPGVVLSGEFLPGGGFMSLVGNISSLSLEASMTSGGIISLTGKIPTIRMEPSALTWEAIISMTDGILPAILLESSMYATMMELNGVIPTLVSGAHIGTVSTLSKVSRFDNYVLRHVR